MDSRYIQSTSLPIHKLSLRIFGISSCLRIQLEFWIRAPILLGLTLANSISLGRYLCLSLISSSALWLSTISGYQVSTQAMTHCLCDGQPWVTYYSDVSLLMGILGWTGGNGF